MATITLHNVFTTEICISKLNINTAVQYMSTINLIYISQTPEGEPYIEFKSGEDLEAFRNTLGRHQIPFTFCPWHMSIIIRDKNISLIIK